MVKSEGPVSQFYSPHHHVDVPGTFTDLLRSVKMLKREWVRKATGSYRTYSIPGKTAVLVSGIAVEDLPRQNCSLSSALGQNNDIYILDIRFLRYVKN